MKEYKITFEDGFIGQRNKLIIELFYVTGIRLSELINIKIKDIDFQNQLIKVLGKRNKERLIPLSPSMIQLLKSFIKKMAEAEMGAHKMKAEGAALARSEGKDELAGLFKTSSEDEKRHARMWEWCLKQL